MPEEGKADFDIKKLISSKTRMMKLPDDMTNALASFQYRFIVLDYYINIYLLYWTTRIISRVM